MKDIKKNINNDKLNNNNQEEVKNQQLLLENQNLEETQEQQSTDYAYDVGNTRMYFNNNIEKIARFSMLFSHLFIIATIFIDSTGISKLMVEGSAILNFTYVNSIAYKAITVIILIFSILSSLFLLLPVLLIRKLKTVRGWAIVWLTVGVLYCGFWLAIAIAITINQTVEKAYIAVILASFAFIFTLFGAISLLMITNYNSRKLQEAIVESYQNKW